MLRFPIRYKNSRSFWLVVVTIVFSLGFSSRLSPLNTIFHPSFGDAAYAILLYAGWRFLLPTATPSLALLFSMLWCLLVECIHLFHNLNDPLKSSIPFYRWIFGQGFQWIDLYVYALSLTLFHLVVTRWIFASEKK